MKGSVFVGWSQPVYATAFRTRISVSLICAFPGQSTNLPLPPPARSSWATPTGLLQVQILRSVLCYESGTIKGSLCWAWGGLEHSFAYLSHCQEFCLPSSFNFPPSPHRSSSKKSDVPHEHFLFTRCYQIAKWRPQSRTYCAQPHFPAFSPLTQIQGQEGENFQIWK